MKSSFEFLLKMTFRVMNKVMNNLKNLCNSTVNELVNENVNHLPKDFKKGCNFAAFFFAINKHAFELSIIPSLRTRRLLSAKVFPVDVISVIISEEPMKGYVSVAPRLGINLYWVTPFEI